MVIMQMHPEKNLQVLLMSPWVTHLCKGFYFFLLLLLFFT